MTTKKLTYDYKVLRDAANRSTRYDSDVAMLCEHALNAAEYIKNTEWQIIKTIPDGICVDVWIMSSRNNDYGRRACSISMVGGKWYGEDAPNTEYGEYAAYWRPVPERPKND